MSEKDNENEKLKKKSERAINRLILIGAIILFLIVIIIGLLLHYSPKY